MSLKKTFSQYYKRFIHTTHDALKVIIFLTVLALLFGIAGAITVLYPTQGEKSWEPLNFIIGFFALAATFALLNFEISRHVPKKIEKIAVFAGRYFFSSTIYFAASMLFLLVTNVKQINPSLVWPIQEIPETWFFGIIGLLALLSLFVAAWQFTLGIWNSLEVANNISNEPDD